MTLPKVVQQSRIVFSRFSWRVSNASFARRQIVIYIDGRVTVVVIVMFQLRPRLENVVTKTFCREAHDDRSRARTRATVSVSFTA